MKKLILTLAVLFTICLDGNSQLSNLGKYKLQIKGEYKEMLGKPDILIGYRETHVEFLKFNLMQKCIVVLCVPTDEEFTLRLIRNIQQDYIYNSYGDYYEAIINNRWQRIDIIEDEKGNINFKFSIKE